MQAAPLPNSPWRRHAPLLLALLALCAVYAQTLSFSFVNWDDPQHVYRNPGLLDRAHADPRDVWLAHNLGYPMPVTLATYAVDRSLFGPTTLTDALPQQGRGYHATQFVLAILYLLAAYALFLALLDQPAVAAWEAALCVLHPMAVEPLAWISGRKDVLAALFVLLALQRLWRAVTQPGKPRIWLEFALLGALALASKPIAVLLLPMSLWLLWVQRPGLTQPARRIALIALTFLAALAATVTALSLAWQREAGALSGEAPVPYTLRNALWALGFHAKLWLWPLDLRPKYVVSPPPGFSALDALALLVLGVLLAGALHRQTRKTAVGFGCALALCAYLPVSNLIGLKRFVADTYLFLPTAGISLAIAGALQPPFSRLPRRLRLAAALLPLALCAVLSLHQVNIWRNSVALWSHTVALEPDSPEVCRMLGHAYGEENQPRASIDVYLACMQRFGPAPFANNLAVTALRAGDNVLAKQWFSWILARNPRDDRARHYLDQLR